VDENKESATSIVQNQQFRCNGCSAEKPGSGRELHGKAPPFMTRVLVIGNEEHGEVLPRNA
jgi:alpha-L-arabinofuranosidase